MEAKLVFDISEEELPIFRAEADDQLQILEEGLVELERQPTPDLVQTLFRAAHTLKGSAGMIGHKRMVGLTHALESVLDGMRKNSLDSSSDVIDVALGSLDSLHRLVDEVSLGEITNLDIQPLVKALTAFVVQPGQAGGSNDQAKSVSPINSSQSKDNDAQALAPDGSLVVRAIISPDSIASAARAFQLMLAIQDKGEILEMEPDLAAIETAAPVSTFCVRFRPQKSIAEIRKAISQIADVEELMIGEERIDNQETQEEAGPASPAPGGQPRLQLGEFLVAKGLISRRQLENALEVQKNLDGPATPIGHTIVSLGYISQEVLDEVLAEQNQQKSIAKAQVESESGDKGKNKIVDKMVRTSVERLDNLMNLIGELITDRNRMFQLRRELELQYRGSQQVESISETIMHVSRITDMLQSEVMGIRMLPVSNVFNKFPRLVRDLARNADKQIDLVIRGEDTELDRSVIEVISDPLIHLIRNAVDHGVETPAERLAAGKPDRGIILLTARHEQGRIFLTVEDNGRGIDHQRVKAKAVEKGLISQAEAEALSNEEAADLIFLSGLSTAKKVSDVSGRGVGMDIVRNNIERLNGNILIESWPGKGTQFTIVLPLTLAIVPTLLVKVGRASFAVPLVTVSETLRIKPQDIQSVNSRPVIVLREHVLPVSRLCDLFEFNGSKNSDLETQFEYVVVVKSGKSQMGLIVDSLIGEEEVVVKSLSTLIGEITGISSAAILGDGQVALIIDTQGLIKLATTIQEKGSKAENPKIRG